MEICRSCIRWNIGAMFIAGNVFKIKFKGDHSGGNPYADLLLIASIPVAAGIIGGVIGANTDDYQYYDLTKYSNKQKEIVQRLKIIINEGIRYGY